MPYVELRAEGDVKSILTASKGRNELSIFPQLVYHNFTVVLPKKAVKGCSSITLSGKTVKSYALRGVTSGRGCTVHSYGFKGTLIKYVMLNFGIFEHPPLLFITLLYIDPFPLKSKKRCSP